MIKEFLEFCPISLDIKLNGKEFIGKGVFGKINKLELFNNNYAVKKMKM